MLFPAGMSGAAKREKMAIMETAISSRLRHPNIVQLFAFYLRPVDGLRDGGELAAAAVRCRWGRQAGRGPELAVRCRSTRPRGSP